MKEHKEATMARFLVGLNSDIVHQVELHHHVDIEEMVHFTEKIEQQLKRSSTSKGYSARRANSWNFSWNRDQGKREKVKKLESTKLFWPNVKSKEVASTLTSRNRDITCFKCLEKCHIASQCPNRWVMFINKDGDYGTEEKDNSETITELKEENEEKDTGSDVEQ